MARLKLGLPDPVLFSTEIPIRISDINYGGHLGNDAVLALAHEARMRFLRSFGCTEHDVLGAGIIMSDAAVVYRSEGLHGDVLRIDVGIADPQPMRCDLLYCMTNTLTGREVARVKTGIVFFDYTRRKPVDMPPDFLLRAGVGGKGKAPGNLPVA